VTSRSSHAAVGAVLLAAALFGTTGTAQALGPGGSTPLGVGAARLAVGGLALLALLPLLGSRPSAAVALWRTPLGVLAGLCTALYQVCFFAGVDRAGVALGTLVTIGSGPVFAGALAAVLLRDRPGRGWLFATALCVAGLALLTSTSGGSEPVEVVGLLLALTSGLAYAAYTVAAKALIGAGHGSATVMASAFGLGGVVLLPVLALQPLAWLAQPDGIALALYLGLVTTAVAYVLFGRGLAVLPAGPVTTLVLAEPLVATVLGVGLLGEQLAAAGAVGAALVLAGLVVQGLVATRRAPVPVPTT
jgi:DME family drug/metabolite transporter